MSYKNKLRRIQNKNPPLSHPNCISLLPMNVVAWIGLSIPLTFSHVTVVLWKKALSFFNLLKNLAFFSYKRSKCETLNLKTTKEKKVLGEKNKVTFGCLLQKIVFGQREWTQLDF